MSDNEATKETEEKKDGKAGKVSKATATTATTTSTSMVINIILVVVVVALAGCVVFLLSGKGKDKKDADSVESKRENVVNEDNVQNVLEQLDKNGSVVPGNYEVIMNATWKFADGEAASSNAYVENAESNTNAVYFDVVRSDTGETVYKSPVLPLGTHISGFKLDTKLSKGKYDAVVVYHLIDDDQNTLSTVSMKITIIIEA